MSERERLCRSCMNPLFVWESDLCLSCWMYDSQLFADVMALGGIGFRIRRVNFQP